MRALDLGCDVRDAVAREIVVGCGPGGCGAVECEGVEDDDETSVGLDGEAAEKGAHGCGHGESGQIDRVGRSKAQRNGSRRGRQKVRSCRCEIGKVKRRNDFRRDGVNDTGHAKLESWQRRGAIKQRQICV